jgi:hypothetical protein
MDTNRKQRFQALLPHLDERMRRLIAAAETIGLGHGGISEVSRDTGVSRRGISLGLAELNNTIEKSRSNRQIREKGGGRKKTVDIDPTLKVDLESLIEPITRGDPESPLLWTCRSVRNLSNALNSMGHKTSHRMVNELLWDMGYSLQGNKKTKEGSEHPDRNEQFEFIYQKTKEFQNNKQPVISVDTKKKELVGDFQSIGKEWNPKGKPPEVRVHDFEIPELGKVNPYGVNPYGVYDITQNIGWVNVGIDNDTAEFAVESIRKWWFTMGKVVYPYAQQLLITADGGGSNGYRVRLWKLELQKFADETGLSISVCHLPPGTSKWNKIEHRLFSFISQNWRGKPLVSHEVIINLISSTKTRTGLTVNCNLDTKSYEKGRKLSDEEMKSINIVREQFHGEWNYTIFPM